SYEDLEKYKCTFEEREEYEPIIKAGFVVYAGVDYEKILRLAESESDVIIWDGGNNDLPFFKPDLWITITDSHRAGDEVDYPHGFWNLKNADIVLINKTGSANPRDVESLLKNIDKNKKSQYVLVCKTDMEITVESPESLKGKYVIAIEDGPTVTHGGMSYGAAVLAAKKYDAVLADPRPYLDEPLRKVFDKYPHLWDTKILPCMGYSTEDIEALERTIKVTPADMVLYSSPIDLNRVIKSFLPMIQAKYELVFNDETEEVLFKMEVLDRTEYIIKNIYRI
ncbi:MAG: GTPase, partial [Patescibacteria group bacterium]